MKELCIKSVNINQFCGIGRKKRKDCQFGGQEIFCAPIVEFPASSPPFCCLNGFGVWPSVILSQSKEMDLYKKGDTNQIIFG